MNYLKKITNSTHKALKSIGKVLDLKQILLVPMNTQPKDVILLYSKVDGKSRNLNGRKEKILNKLRNLYPFKKQGNTKHFFCHKERIDELFNPFITHIQTEEIEAAVIYDKGADSSSDWTTEEMELLQLIGQTVKTDLLFEPGNKIGDKDGKIAEKEQISHQILELQYALPAYAKYPSYT